MELFGVLALSKWGNSLAIRVPKKVLDEFKLQDKDELVYRVDNGKIILEPKREKKLLEKLMEGYIPDPNYPLEIVDKGGAIGEELY